MMWAHNEIEEAEGEWGIVSDRNEMTAVVDASPAPGWDGWDADPAGGDVFVPAGAFEMALADDLAPVGPELPAFMDMAPGLLAFGLISAGAFAWWRHTVTRQRRHTWLEMQTRTWWGLWPGPGFAGWRTLNREYGRRRPRRISKHTRPSLTWRDRWFGDPRAYSLAHGKAHRAWFGLVRHTVRTSYQDNSLILSPGQEGKSAAGVFLAWDAPGPLLCTTIRGDLLEASGGYRATLGELHVWNPAGVGTVGSTFRWNMVAGCEDYATAVRRAYAIVYASNSQGLNDAHFWKNSGAAALSAYLHAAALVMAAPGETPATESGAEVEYVHPPVTMQTVADWLTSLDLEPYEILRLHPGADRNAARALLDLYSAPTNTRGSIVKTLNESLRFMADEAIVEALTPHPTMPEFKIEKFLRSKDSLYLMAPPADTQSPVAPLLSAFTTELYHAAMLTHSKEKLDPHLTMLLDEVANICPVPLPAWLSYSAGSGIQVHTLGQSWAQYQERWGDKGAAQIWNNSKFKMLWPTNDDEITLHQLIHLGGTVSINSEVITDADGKKKRKRVRPYDVDALTNPGTQVPEGYVVCRLRGRRPVLVRARVYWKDKRSKLPLPPLPPVQDRYTPSAMPELRQQVHQDALPATEQLRSGAASGSSGSDRSGRDPGEAPALRRPSAVSVDAASTVSPGSLARRWNPAAPMEADEEL
ncbi:type IV secretory system conjugative DNA transfer family protein [Nocardiopsis changdeensis]|uniref:TraM recognition domain-containing protein n=1 Tax=Nocardiopsis changdeensis TaxID=2831969 RepID=A0A975QCG8_9ACTN|nr:MULTISPECIES: type IV secretory system conjugative DNA transfer family protein [Nocardiopsis]QUX26472.1 TraM recognition domain-containing protein [Nocardiopsis changdeensis]QYX40744.1 TraM recognition domain-containing protein [Nocardiopsis sp. MT53]